MPLRGADAVSSLASAVSARRAARSQFATRKVARCHRTLNALQISSRCSV